MLLLSMGVHPKVVQELLGHNRIQETVDTYSQVLPTIHKEAIKRLEDVLWQ
jgi:site-specific recombinase XerD